MSDSSKKAKKSVTKSKSVQKKTAPAKKSPAKKAAAKKTPAKKAATKKAAVKKAPAKKKAPSKQSVKSAFDSISSVDENELSKNLMASLEETDIVKIDFSDVPREIATSWEEVSVIGEPLLNGEQTPSHNKGGFIKKFFSNLLKK